MGAAVSGVKYDHRHAFFFEALQSISGLVVEYIVAIDVTRVRFPADAFHLLSFGFQKATNVCGWGAVKPEHAGRMHLQGEKFCGRELNPGLPRDRGKY